MAFLWVVCRSWFCGFFGFGLVGLFEELEVLFEVLDIVVAGASA